MRSGVQWRATDKKARDSDKGAALLVLFICLPFCVFAGLVAWMGG